MESTQAVIQPQSDEINLFELWLALLKQKWLILTITCITGLIAALYAFNATPIYQAETLVIPTMDTSKGNRYLAALTSQYSSLASLAGITLTTHNSLSTAIAVLKSRQFIQEFIQDHSLKKKLFPNAWDTRNNAWKTPSENKKAWWNINHFTQPKKLLTMEPDIEAAYQLFKASLSISIDKKTNLVTARFNWTNPKLASEWVNTLITRLNYTLRQQAIDEAQQGIVYLQKQLQSIHLEDLRLVLAQLVQEQIKNITLAKANNEYVFRVLDPAIAPKDPTKPKRKMIILLGIILGLIVGIILALIRNSIRKKPQPQ